MNRMAVYAVLESHIKVKGETMSNKEQDSSTTALDLAKEFFAAKERHDLDTTTELFGDDAVNSFPCLAGKQENRFAYEGVEAVTKQGQALESFKQIKMLDVRCFLSTDGSNVFMESRGDYIAQDGTAYNNVTSFNS